MKLLPLVLLLASCTLDHVSPDRLTIGGGRSAWTGEADMGHGHGADLEGDAESYGASLSWDLPQWGESEHPDDRAALSAAVRASGDEPTDGSMKMNLREGADPPPVVVLYGLVGFLLIFVVIVVMRSRRTNRWH